MFQNSVIPLKTGISISREVQMTDLLIRLFFVFAAMAVISLFVCTLPVWLIVLVVVLLLG